MKGTFLRDEDVGTSEECLPVARIGLLTWEIWACVSFSTSVSATSDPPSLDIQGQETPCGSTQVTEGFPTSKQNGDLPLRVRGLSFPMDR